MSDVVMLRIGILIAGLILIAAIIFFGRPRRAKQGRRVTRDAGVQPSGQMSLGEQIEADLRRQADAAAAREAAATATAAEATDAGEFERRRNAASDLGKRESEEFDRIVTLYLAARAGSLLRGSDIVVAAEKAGLTYGHMSVFHRLLELHPERGPVFSVANVLKPGSFDMADIQSLETPAIAFFLTLPAPVPALDAWEAMLPTAQRMAELLDAVVLDDQRHALERQRIGEIRDELRAYDRQREIPPVTTRSTRW